MRPLALWPLVGWLLAAQVLAEVTEVKPEQCQPSAGANLIPVDINASVVRLVTTRSAGTVMSVAQGLEPGRYRVWFTVAASAYAHLKRAGAAHVPTVALTAFGDAANQQHPADQHESGKDLAQPANPE